MWYGQGGYWICKGLPHYVNLERKPHKGCELYTMSDGIGEFMLRYELVMAKKEHGGPVKKYEDETGAVSTACAMRMCDFFDEGNHVRHNKTKKRIVFADSWFSSVKTAKHIRQMGLDFTGKVKTGTTDFPGDFLTSISLEKFGSVHVKTSIPWEYKKQSINLVAGRWRDKKSHYFISTKGSTKYTETPNVRRKNRTVKNDEGFPVSCHVNNVTIDMPLYMQEFFKYNDGVDRHNRNRADIKIESKHKTVDWQYRLFTSLLSALFVDTYKFYKGSRKDEKKADSPKKFNLELALALARYSASTTVYNSRSRNDENSAPSNVPSLSTYEQQRVNARKRRLENLPDKMVGDSVPRTLVQNKERGSNRSKRMKCVDCQLEDQKQKKLLTSWVCNKCGKNIHSVSQSPACWQNHCNSNNCSIYL